MTVLMRCSDITAMPVVTMTGEAIAQVKDTVYSPDGGQVTGFTLAGRGIFAGPLKTALPWGAVAALGADALMIISEDELPSLTDVLSSAATDQGAGGDVLGAEVLTDTGVILGTVIDVIVQVRRPGSACEVIGYEISSTETHEHHGSSGRKGGEGGKMLLPLPDTLAVSAEHLMVPASATEFVREDLAGFGAAVDAFRAHLKGTR